MSSICPKCERALKFVALDCPHCGAILPLPSAASPPSPPSRSPLVDPGPIERSTVQRSTPQETLYEGPASDPYAAPRSALDADAGTLWSPTGLVAVAPLATRGSRLAARFVDGFLMIGCSVPVVFTSFPLFAEGSTPFEEGTALSPVMTAGILASGVLFLVLMVVNFRLIGREGQTLGKRACGVRVLRLDGQPITLGRWIGLRTMVPSLLGRIPIAGPIFGIVNVLTIFGEERRCIHDRFADTKVVAVDRRG